MRYAHYDNSTGEILGFYSEETHGTFREEGCSIPSTSIQTTKEEWENCLNNQSEYKVDLDTLELIHDPHISTLEEEKNKKLSLVRRIAGQLINDRFKDYDIQNLFVLENKTDIQDYYLDTRATKQGVSDAINAMRDACNSLEDDINNATDKTTLENLDLSKDILINIAGW